MNDRKPLRHDRGARATIAAFLRENEIILLGAAAAAAGILGYVGVHKYARSVRDTGPLTAAYYLLQLFLFEAGLDIENAGVPWQLGVARILAPLVVGYAALKGLAALFRDQLNVFRVRFRNRHVIICGLGRKGLQLVREHEGKRVVVIEPDAENDDLATARSLGAAVIIGNAAEPSILRKAMVHRAASIFAVTGNDGANVEISVAVSQCAGPKPDKNDGPLRCFVHINDVRLISVIKQHSLFTNPHDGIDVRIVRTNDISARLLFQEFPLDYLPILPDSKLRPHLIIAGFGRMGESVAVQAARIGQFAGHKKVAISIVDRIAEEKESLLLAAYPQFRKVADIEFINGDIESSHFYDRVEQWTSDENALPTVVVSINDNTKALTCALNCLERTAPRGIPVHVRLDADEGVAALLRDHGKAGDSRFGRIHPFGLLSVSCSMDMIENRPIDRLARKIHENYLQNITPEREGNGAGDWATQLGNPALRSWERLDSVFKDSNRQQADHIAVKLRAIGCSRGIADPRLGANRVTAFDERELTLLAIMEHDRWTAERLLAGWRFGEKKDPATKVTPHLRPWEELQPEVRAFDMESVIAIPRILEFVGEWIYRGDTDPESVSRLL